MKRFYILLALLSFVVAGSTHAATQDELYVSFYQKIQQADSLIGRKQEKAAVDLYRAAKAGLEKLKKDNPGWNKQIVDFRLDYIQGKLGPLESKFPATAPAKPAPKKNKPAPTVVQTQLSAINEELIQERMKSADLRNKLKEALAAKPAEVDPAEHARLQSNLAAANEKAGALTGELEALKKKAEDMIAADEAKQLKKALEDSETLASKRMKEIESLKADQSKAAGELEKLEKTELPGLRSENTALKRQVKDLEKQAGSTAKAEKAAQQIGAQNKLLARELEDARDAAKTAGSKLSSLNEEVARKDAALVKMSRELDALELRIKNSGESSKAASLRKENSALKKQVSSLTRKASAVEKAEKAADVLEKQNKSLAEELKALRDRGEETAKKLAGMVSRDEIEKTADQLDDATKELAKLRASLNEAASENAGLEKALKAAEAAAKAGRDAGKLKARSEKLQKQNDSLEKQLKAAQDATEAKDRQISKMIPKADVEKAQDAAEAAVKARDRAEAALLKAQRESADLAKKLKAADASKRSSDLRKENAALKKQVSALSRKAKDAEKIPGLQAEVLRFEAAVKEQAAALKRLQTANETLTELLNDPKVQIQK